MITESYGHCAHGFIVGGGLGRNAALKAECDRIAEILLAEFGKPLQKRGNSDGLSSGAYYDLPADPGRLWGDTIFGISAYVTPDDDTIRYWALFHRRSERFASFPETLEWLKEQMNRAEIAGTKRGFKYCGKCGGDTTSVLDGEAWCENCKRYQ